MTTVWKFPLPAPCDHFTLEMPVGAFPLRVAMQGNTPCLWARVNPEHPTETRRFRWAGTGHPLEDSVGRYVDTFEMHGGALVFHIFEAPQHVVHMETTP
jgi:hypothetical protein